MDRVRETCLLCTAKHLAQARVLLMEAKKGYDYHYVYALGHIAEAEDESADQYPDFAQVLRNERKRLEEDSAYEIDFKALICSLIGKMDEEENEIAAKLEAEFNDMSVEELSLWWNNPGADDGETD